MLLLALAGLFVLIALMEHFLGPAQLSFGNRKSRYRRWPFDQQKLSFVPPRHLPAVSPREASDPPQKALPQSGKELP
jgi:hypothetical protein